jgi:hypothetical protein
VVLFAILCNSTDLGKAEHAACVAQYGLMPFDSYGIYCLAAAVAAAVPPHQGSWFTAGFVRAAVDVTKQQSNFPHHVTCN